MNVPPDPDPAPDDRAENTSAQSDGTTDAADADAVDADTAAREAATERRRRLAEEIVAGMLPGTTGDERPSGADTSGFSEQWYRENRPPHHG